MKKIILPALVFLGPVSAMAETIQLDCSLYSIKVKNDRIEQGTGQTKDFIAVFELDSHRMLKTASSLNESAHVNIGEIKANVTLDSWAKNQEVGFHLHLAKGAVAAIAGAHGSGQLMLTTDEDEANFGCVFSKLKANSGSDSGEEQVGSGSAE